MKTDSCKYCSECRMVDIHKVCSLCDHLSASLKYMNSYKSLSEISPSDIESCKLDPYYAFGGFFEAQTFINACDHAVPQGSAVYNDMIYNVKMVNPCLAIKPPMWTSKCSDCHKEMLVDTREEKRCIPCDKKYHMLANTCGGCKHYGVDVHPVCRHSNQHVCNICYDKFIDWHGDVGVLVDGDMIERAFTSWRMLETTNPPHFEIGFKQKKEK